MFTMKMSAQSFYEFEVAWQIHKSRVFMNILSRTSSDLLQAEEKTLTEST